MHVFIIKKICVSHAITTHGIKVYIVGINNGHILQQVRIIACIFSHFLFSLLQLVHLYDTIVLFAKCLLTYSKVMELVKLYD